MKRLQAAWVRWLGPTLLAGGFFLLPRGAAAAEITAFASGANPGPFWARGFGGSLAITLFDVGGVEVEGARQGGDVPDSSMLSFSGRAFLAPPTGRLIPYGGLAAGVYRQKLGSDDDWGTVKGIFVGVKFKVGLSFQVRGEYEWISLPDKALLPMEGRYSLGATLRF